jgi:pyocin large subunit-like protein
MAVGLISAGVAPEVPYIAQGIKSIVIEFGWELLSQCSASMACWKAVSILTGVSSNYSSTKSNSYSFKTPELLQGHFDDHGSLLGYSSEVEYLQGANNLFAAGPGVEKIIRSSDSATLFWRTSTYEFGVLSSDGIIQTYFLPDTGLLYWLWQIEKWGK